MVGAALAGLPLPDFRAAYLVFQCWRRGMPRYSILLLPIVLMNSAVASAQDPVVPGIRTKQKLTILSANDGYIHRRPNPDAKDKKLITQDSITVIHLGPDHPPIVK